MFLGSPLPAVPAWCLGALARCDSFCEIHGIGDPGQWHLSPLAIQRGSTPLCAAAQNKHTQNVIRTLVVIGVGMILGDGVLTPSVSVLSAMEGLAVAIPSVQKGSRAPLPLCI